jgi:hypothetical protein
MTTLAPSSFKGDQPEFLPMRVFAGATSSTGVLENGAGAPTRRFHVEGKGEMLPGGDFRLDQSVTFVGHPTKTRTWIIRRVDQHDYTATLTDASGPVTAEAYGNLFHLKYPTKSPPAGTMEQWMYLQPDGRTVMNEATVRSYGIVVAHLSERITQTSPPPPAP